MLEMGLAKLYPYTEFEVSIHPYQIYGRGFKILKNLPLDPDHAPFGDILSSLRWDLPGSIHIPNLKSL